MCAVTDVRHACDCTVPDPPAGTYEDASPAAIRDPTVAQSTSPDMIWLSVWPPDRSPNTARKALFALSKCRAFSKNRAEPWL
jgi:hypothetical protein